MSFTLSAPPELDAELELRSTTVVLVAPSSSTAPAAAPPPAPSRSTAPSAPTARTDGRIERCLGRSVAGVGLTADMGTPFCLRGAEDGGRVAQAGWGSGGASAAGACGAPSMLMLGRNRS